MKSIIDVACSDIKNSECGHLINPSGLFDKDKEELCFKCELCDKTFTKEEIINLIK